MGFSVSILSEAVIEANRGWHVNAPVYTLYHDIKMSLNSSILLDITYPKKILSNQNITSDNMPGSIIHSKKIASKREKVMKLRLALSLIWIG